MTGLTPSELSVQVRRFSQDVGFDIVGITPAVSANGFADFQEWLNKGYAGEMQWMSRREAAYEHPSSVMQGVRSIVMVGINYRTDEPVPTEQGSARISRYAWNDIDYHDLIRDRLKQLANRLHDLIPGVRTRGIVDTAPLLERDFARQAGLGWQGKNTLLINKRLGSWMFLAALLIDVELEPDAPHEAYHCGTCTKCLDECPTDAFPEPGVLDSRRCIAYLNIELRNQPIPTEFRAGIGDWLLGCDVCQDVCPWNRKAPAGHTEFKPSDGMNPINCRELLKLTDEEFDQRFGSTPLARPGRIGILRNAAIILGNQRDQASVSLLADLLTDESEIIRGAAAWSLGQMDCQQSLNALKAASKMESDPDVRSEIQSACQQRHSENDPGTGNAPPHRV